MKYLTHKGWCYDFIKRTDSDKQETNHLPCHLRTVAELFKSKGDKITARTILAYELGDRQPSALYIQGLINYLDINPYWLLSDKGEIL